MGGTRRVTRGICIHGHFYQPPRIDPWLGEVPYQESASPFHDWNERIWAECYAPNTAARILDDQERIIDITNNYASISFDAGPTLLSWLQTHHPPVYEAILRADETGRKSFSGHGPALAQAYHHAILPLSHPRDVRTEVIWGIEDFVFRFRRQPEGMWLPECAVDTGTLEALAEQGISFTILSPYQAKRIRAVGDDEWVEVRNGLPDPTMPYLCPLPSGRSLVIFFYEPLISGGIAFGDLLRDGGRLAGELERRLPGDPALVSVATDGETFGHHRRFGEMALAYAIRTIRGSGTPLTIYGEYLAEHPPTHEVEIVDHSSWSCPHGVERWRSDCTCSSGHPEWSRGWRAPLREAMDFVRDRLAPFYERETGKYLDDPWRARDRYIEVVVDRSPSNVDRFLSAHAPRPLSGSEQVRVLSLLEMERFILMMYTSCGWYFDDIGGIEPLGVMACAARAMDLARRLGGPDLEPRYVEILGRAKSNDPELRDGAFLYNSRIRPRILDLGGVAAHQAMRLLGGNEETASGVYMVNSEGIKRVEYADRRGAIGTLRICHRQTREEGIFRVAAVCTRPDTVFAGVGVAGVHEHLPDPADLQELLRNGDEETFSTWLSEQFERVYTFENLSTDEQRTLLASISADRPGDLDRALQETYRSRLSEIETLASMHLPLPLLLRVSASYVLNTDLLRELERQPADPAIIQKTAAAMEAWAIHPDPALSPLAGRRINALLHEALGHPLRTSPLENACRLVATLIALPLPLDLWESQNLLFGIWKEHGPSMQARAEEGDTGAERWLA
ncbi:MAG: DUF3536 domain-containing protein, partial [Methanomicrobiaceae archaeon]|nr:DUF3536 domain-containing protein [Methanomicrobiaceae archaeon]